MNISDILQQHSLSQTELATRYNIPLRTVQNWCSTGSNHRECPTYVAELIEKDLAKEQESLSEV